MSSSSSEEEMWGADDVAFEDEKGWLVAGRDGEAMDDGDSDEMLQVELDAASGRRDAEVQAAEARAEFHVAGEGELFRFPTERELEAEELQPVEPRGLQIRIAGVLQVLARFSELREEERTREHYVELLERDLRNYYGYNSFLVKQVLKIFSPAEAVEFMEANETPRPLTIRTNTLRARRRDLAQALLARGINLDPAGEWTPVGLQIHDSAVPVGATPEYLAGHYMLQGAASWLPVMSLDPKPHEKILDMCAAPGGKTSYIAAQMQNTGILFANDANRERLRGLVGNLHRLGVTNAVVTNLSGIEYPRTTGGFDRVLLDAPCSGLGVISRDPRVKLSKSLADVQTCFELQKKLILHAIDSVNANSKKGGVIVYCTCTFSVEENEQIVQYALERRNVKLVDSGLEFGVPGMVKYRKKRFHPSMNLTRRYYPHVHNFDGFFVAKLQKISNEIPSDAKKQEEQVKLAKERKEAKKRKKRSARKRRAGLKLAAMEARVNAKKRREGASSEEEDDVAQ